MSAHCCTWDVYFASHSIHSLPYDMAACTVYLITVDTELSNLTAPYILHVYSGALNSAAVKKKERASSVTLRTWVTLRLYFRLKGYVSRQYLYINRYMEMVTLQLCRWKFSHKET